MKQTLFLISFFLAFCPILKATETISESPMGGEMIRDLKSNDSLNTINEENRQLRKIVADLDQRLKAGGL
jgi:hypothetical protein